MLNEAISDLDTVSYDASKRGSLLGFWTGGNRSFVYLGFRSVLLSKGSVAKRFADRKLGPSCKKPLWPAWLPWPPCVFEGGYSCYGFKVTLLSRLRFPEFATVLKGYTR